MQTFVSVAFPLICHPNFFFTSGVCHTCVVSRLVKAVHRCVWMHARLVPPGLDVLLFDLDWKGTLLFKLIPFRRLCCNSPNALLWPTVHQHTQTRMHAHAGVLIPNTHHSGMLKDRRVCFWINLNIRLSCVCVYMWVGFDLCGLYLYVYHVLVVAL